MLQSSILIHQKQSYNNDTSKLTAFEATRQWQKSATRTASTHEEVMLVQIQEYRLGNVLIREPKESSTKGTKGGLKIFCYSLVLAPTNHPDIHSEDLIGFQKNIAHGCDGWALYSTSANQNLSVTKAFPETKSNENFFNRNDTFLHVWKEHINQKLYDFDFFVKLDADVVVRPAAFRQMFTQHDIDRKPMVLSVSDCHPAHPETPSEHVCVDGYFVAVSQVAAKRILSLKHPEDCRLAAFGDFVGNSNDEQLLKQCVQATGISFKEPLDAQGFHLIPFDRRNCPAVMPIEAAGAQVLASGKPLCQEDVVTGKCCYSPQMALFHGVKNKAQRQALHIFFSAEGL